MPLGRVFLMTSWDQVGTSSHSVSGHEVASRMAASLAYERAPLVAAVHARRFAFPDAVGAALGDLEEIERDRLHHFLDGIEATEVVHPYPPDLGALIQAMGVLEGADR